VIGGSLVITAVTGYCCYKKKKKKVLLVAGSEGEEAESSKNELANNEIVEENSLQQDKKIPDLPSQNLKSDELVQLIQQAKRKISENLVISLETLLDAQAEITRGNNNFSIRQLQREAKEKLIKKLTIEEINNLCQLQAEVTKLEAEDNNQVQAQIEVVPQQQILANPQ